MHANAAAPHTAFAAAAPRGRSLVRSGWILISVAWLILLVVPTLQFATGFLFAIMLATPVLLVALILAIVSMTRGHDRAGLMQVLAILLGSPLVLVCGMAWPMLLQ